MKKTLVILTSFLVCLFVCVLTSDSLAAEITKRVPNSRLSAPFQGARVTTDASGVEKSNGQMKPSVRLQVRPQSMKGTFTPAIRIPSGDAHKAQILQEMAQPVRKHTK